MPDGADSFERKGKTYVITPMKVMVASAQTT